MGGRVVHHLMRRYVYCGDIRLKRVVVGKSLDLEMSLWRYMSLDKFIDLVNNKKLFLTPLSYYQATDPFEGFTPKVAFEATTNIFLKGIEELEAQSQLIENMFQERISSGATPPTPEQYQAISTMKNSVQQNRADLVPRNNKISKSTCVHCWYHSESESEAMWKLYSDSGKGIAIKTTVGSLVSALDLCQPKVPLHIGRVKYLDFLSEHLTPKECVTDGVTAPLLKRQEYSHENEVRLFSVPQCLTAKNWREYKPTPILVDVDTSTLIEAIYISPYVGEPFTSSVYKICELFEIPKNKVVTSQLLKNYEEVLLGYVK
ncbi:DUF2971 domain-containing protein [Vibrio genomosp. F10 str. 9ZC157]|uniref:DUF2971 domain-containing protein n=1 Tax=Vibrio genomosp. F10 TaxID=723171 RepID=UPI001F52803A|nr:DUF2971 domain-containing protein [Vibrio genomosp. F10]